MVNFPRPLLVTPLSSRHVFLSTSRDRTSLPMTAAPADIEDRIRDNLGPLINLTRPKNFPGVVLFHTMGVFLALRESPLGLTNFWSILLRTPALWLSLLSLLLVDSSSMVVNDYYDARLGRDVPVKEETARDRVLVSGKVDFAITKRFVSYLYATALVLQCFLPGIPTRLSVVGGLMLTFLYTQHMKPITWLKNVVCASLIGVSPWTSASATLHAVVYPVLGPTSSTIALPSLWRLIGALFAGVLGREILMDCNDVETDARSAVRTVPVKHGKPFAVKVAFASTLAMSLLTLGAPLRQLWMAQQPQQFARTLWRRVGFGLVASGTMLYRGWDVLRTEGQDATKIQTAVDEGLLSVLFILMSFL